MSVGETTSRPPLDKRLEQSTDGILEHIAREYAVSTFDVVCALPAENRTIVPGDKLETVLGELTRWGEVLFIVHTADIVLECAGKIPPGNLGRGYFNLHGDSPIGGAHQGRQLLSYCVREPPLHGTSIPLPAVLQSQRRSDVQGLRAA